MITIRFILADQLSNSISSLVDITSNDVVLMCEVMEEATYVKHHPKKLTFLFAAMRHFARELEEQEVKVRYIKLDDDLNTQSLIGELKRAQIELKATNIIVTEPSEYRVKKMLELYQKDLDINIDMLPDNRFLCSIDEFNSWSKNKKQLRMEYFYREMRRKYNILVKSDGQPIGGIWNYDKENRKTPTEELTSPKRLFHKKSIILKEVIKLVKEKFPTHFGDLEPFYYAINRQQALMELQYFIDNILPDFGDYQDAMMKSEPYLKHSLLSSYINVGFLLPLEICKKVELAYYNAKVSLNTAEGFIRQILGWREYVRGIYWQKMPAYANLNYFDAKLSMPDFYWGGKTNMTCMAEAIKHTKEHSYSHHIQRLMVTGNFALITGLDVKEVQDWYLAVYSDAYEWVEMPNTLGMALYADGGILGSKPYAASGKYINKMSNFCKSCCYDPQEMLTKNACPFNAMYWDFIARNRNKLQGNQRLFYVYNTWDKFDQEKQQSIRNKAADIILDLIQGKL